MTDKEETINISDLIPHKDSLIANMHKIFESDEKKELRTVIIESIEKIKDKKLIVHFLSLATVFKSVIIDSKADKKISHNLINNLLTQKESMLELFAVCAVSICEKAGYSIKKNEYKKSEIIDIISLSHGILLAVEYGCFNRLNVWIKENK